MTRRNGRWWWPCVLAMMFSLSAVVAGAEVLYVQAKSAQLRAGKTSLDPVLTNIRYGEAVEVLSRDGNWTEVKTAGGARGWIFSSKLSASKPPGAGDTLARLGQSMRSGEASSSTASAGARGLDKTSEGYADRAGISPRDREAVDRMTSYQVSDDDVEQFLKEGGLGEYAK
ncbi:MAG TPA: SH3 domain-containing protein [Nitrospiraceae bacterium]|nr:SH3 domain-containing protein [Nitrospiraceae bacterium]